MIRRYHRMRGATRRNRKQLARSFADQFGDRIFHPRSKEARQQGFQIDYSVNMEMPLNNPADQQEREAWIF
jgi:hypothetical protein